MGRARRILPPQADRIEHNQLAHAMGLMSRKLARHHAAERRADDRHRFQSERVEDFLVDQQEIPQAFDRIDYITRRFAGAWMMRSINRVAFAKALDERIPDRPAGRVQIEKRRSAAGGFHLGFEVAMLDRDRLHCGGDHGSIPIRKDMRSRLRHRQPLSDAAIRRSPSRAAAPDACAASSATNGSPTAGLPKVFADAGEPRARTIRYFSW